MWQGYRKLGELLVAEGHISNLQLSIALAAQKEAHKRLGAILVEKGFVTERQITDSLARQYGYTVIDVNTVTPTRAALSVLPKEAAEAMTVLPIEDTEKGLICVVSDPIDVVATDEIARITGKRVQLRLAYESDLRGAIKRAYSDFVQEETESDGTIFGIPERFVGVRLRGAGNNSAWFRAFDNELQRDVCLAAIEECSSHHAEMQTAIRWAAGAKSPSVASIYDSTIYNGTRWTVFEPVDGETLGEYLKNKGALGLPDAAALVAGVAEAIVKTPNATPNLICVQNIVIKDDNAKLMPLAPPDEPSPDVLSALGQLLFSAATGHIDCPTPGLASESYQKLPRGIRDVIRRCLPIDPFRYSEPYAVVVALRSITWEEETLEQPTTNERNALLEMLPPPVIQPQRSFWSRLFGSRKAA